MDFYVFLFLGRMWGGIQGAASTFTPSEYSRSKVKISIDHFLEILARKFKLVAK